MSTNWNGKLLNDVFTTIRLYNYEKYPDFEKYEIEYKNQVLGICEIVSKKTFRFEALNSTTSFIDVGKDEIYSRALFKKFYPAITGEQPMYMLVLRWVERHKEPTELLFKERFDKISEPWIQPVNELQTQLSFE
jgi:hypothetical protein